MTKNELDEHCVRCKEYGDGCMVCDVFAAYNRDNAGHLNF